MNLPAVQVEELKKRYRLGETHAGSLRGVLHRSVAQIARLGRRMRPASPAFGPRQTAASRDFWALKGLTFELQPGSVVGIVGRNGAGKSTLLKILSRITKPTSGSARLHGRVASLLEVGTGFHPELTGRENVFLNGAILGMTKADIRRKLDAIVAFAELPAFIDTPVKRYSSGMYVRLAFAVAAHLEPEILIVDEVLAVGDAGFQAKCLNKLSEVSHTGNTVLFVSHNIPAVESLCDSALLLDQGSLIGSGRVDAVIAQYLSLHSAQKTGALAERTDRGGNGQARILSLEVRAADGEEAIDCSSRLRISLNYEAQAPITPAAAAVGIYDESGNELFLLSTDYAKQFPRGLPAAGTLSCVTDPIHLSPGRCTVNAALIQGTLQSGTLLDYIEGVTTFHVAPNDFYGTGRLPDRRSSLLLVPQTWQVEV